MNTDKKSFILHLDMLSVIDGMTDEQAGRLFKAMRSYHMGSEVDLDAVTSMAFSFFKMQFDRDNEKYHNRVESNRSNGAKGGRPKKNKDLKTENPKNTVGYSKTQENPKNPSEPKKPDNDNVNDNDNDNVKDKEKTDRVDDAFNKFWSSYHKRQGKAQALKASRQAVKREKPETPDEFADMLIDDCRKRIESGQFGFDNLNASTYLNNNRWEDEIVTKSTEKSDDPWDDIWIPNWDTKTGRPR